MEYSRTSSVKIPVTGLVFLLLLILTPNSDALSDVVVAWGNRAYTGTTGSQYSAISQPITISTAAVGTELPPIVSVTAQRDLAFGLDDSSAIWMWGDFDGQRMRPFRVNQTVLPSGQIRSLHGAGHAVFALHESGSIYSWSWGPKKPIGEESILGREVPRWSSSINETEYNLAMETPDVVVTNITASNMGCTDTFCIAIGNSGTAGTLVSWVSNCSTESPLYNMLGLDQFSAEYDVCLPFKVPTPDDKVIAHFALGYNWYSIVTLDNRIYSTGINTHGQFGSSANPTTPSFQLEHEHMENLNGITSLAAGRSHALCANGLGQVYGWGANNLGQLGTFDAALTHIPQRIPFPPESQGVAVTISLVSAVLDTSYALSAFGDLYAWGSNSRCYSSTVCPETSQYMLGTHLGLHISRTTPSLVSLPPGFYTRRLVPKSISFDPSHPEREAEYEDKWANFALASLDINFRPMADTTNKGSRVTIWGATRIATPTPEQPLNYATLAPNPLDYTSSGHQAERYLPVTGEIMKIVASYDRVRILMNVPGSIKRNYIYALGGISASLGNPTWSTPIPYAQPPALNQTIAYSSQFIDITDFQSDDLGLQKHNLSSIGITSAAFVVLHKNGILKSYHDDGHGNQIVATKLMLTGEVSDRQLVCGEPHCLLLDSETETLYAWADRKGDETPDPTVGRSATDQTTTPPSEASPVSLPNGDIPIKVYAGYGFSVVLGKNDVYTWGSNLAALGRSTSDPFTPAPINRSPGLMGLNFTALATYVVACHSHTVMILNDRKVVVWGDNTYGQIGPTLDGSFAQYLPADFLLGSSVSIASCTRHTTFLQDVVNRDMSYTLGFNGAGRLFASDFSAHDTRNVTSAPAAQIVLFEPAYGSPTAVSAIGAFIDDLPPQARFDQTNRQPLIVFGEDNNVAFPLTVDSNEYSAGRTVLPGHMDPTANVIGYSATGNTRYFLQQAMWTTYRVYASGETSWLPYFPGIPHDESTENGDTLFIPPTLISSFEADNSPIKLMEAFGGGLMLNLKNHSVLVYPSAQPHPNTLTGFYDDPLIDIDRTSPFYLKTQDEETLLANMVTCDYWTCCVLSLSQSTYCWGSFGPPIPGTQPQPLMSDTPTVALTETWHANSRVMSSRRGLLTSYIDGRLIFFVFDPADDYSHVSIEVTGDLTAFGTLVPNKIETGIAHMVLLTSVGMFISGDEDIFSGLVLQPDALAQKPLGNFTAFYQEQFEDVVDIACWSYSTLWLTSTGALWSYGMTFDRKGDAMNWLPLTLSPLPLHYEPVQVLVPELLTLTKLFSFRAFDPTVAANDTPLAQPLPVAPVIAAAKNLKFPQAPTTPPPIAACSGSLPAPNCECLKSGTWQCAGTTIFTPGITISSPIHVLGSLLFNASFTMDISTNLGDNPMITVSGCADLRYGFTLNLDERYVKSVPKSGATIKVVESSCHQTSLPAIKLVQERKCKTLRVTSDTETSSSGRTTVLAKVSVVSDKCNLWWIILVSVLCSIAVIIPTIIILFYVLGVPAKISALMHGKDEKV